MGQRLLDVHLPLAAPARQPQIQWEKQQEEEEVWKQMKKEEEDSA